MAAAPTASSSTPLRLNGLDVLRGIAVLLVMLRHAFPGVFGGAGVVGVVLFFALSGYLITGSIHRETQRGGRFSFGRFYRNRALRLLPALLLLLVVWSALTLTVDPMRDRGALPLTLLVAVTYTMDFFGTGHVSHALTHLWTLAVEEQFYVLWPFVVVLGARRRLVPVLTAAAAVAYVACVVGVAVDWHTPADVYEVPWTWFVTLALGALAYALRYRVAAVLSGRVEVVAVITASAVLAGFAVLPETKAAAITYLLGGPVIALCGVVLIRSASRWRAERSLIARPLLALGTISYAVYLWDYVIVGALRGTGQLTAGEALLSFPITIAAATVSWFLVERSALRLKARLDGRARAGSPEGVGADADRAAMLAAEIESVPV